MKRALFPVILIAFAIFFTSAVYAADIAVTYNVNTETGKAPISPYIYGGNGQSGSHYAIHRSGGNRLTGYNWENNFSNAGADYGPHNNDNHMVWSQPGIPESEWLVPGKAITYFRDSCIANNQDSIVTLQMAGYVSADGTGIVTLAQKAPSSRWKSVVYVKGAPFCDPPGSPVTTDDNVYMDEFVNFLVSEYGYAGQPNGVKFYDLDNEPALWSMGDDVNGTHPRLHPPKATCVEVKDKSIALSTAVKNVDPNAQILGPVLYGMGAYNDFQGASDWPGLKDPYGTDGWFIDYYLDKMEAASSLAGKRLLDVLDLHWYPEAQDGANHRITQDIYTTAMYNARMQAPRSLWDYDYHEISWIEQWLGKYLPLLPPLWNSINNQYPGTNLAFTEYDYGGKDHYSGGIAVTDVLGIFGKYGVYISNYWGYTGTYLDAAFKIYRNYDGAGSKFGDTKVDATMSNKTDSSIYASVLSEQACELHLVVINKNINDAISGTFNITSPRTFYSGRVWKFSNTSSNITETTSISTITSNSFTYTVPKTSVCHIVLQAEPPYWDLAGSDCLVNIYDLDAFADDWLIDEDTYNFLDFASFGQEWGM